MADRSVGEPPRAPTRAVTWREDALVLWRYSPESKLEGFDVARSVIDDYHLARCWRVAVIAGQVGVSYSEAMSVLIHEFPK